MNRILTVAQSEFLTLVRTKAFIIGILLMPALMVGFGCFMSYAERHGKYQKQEGVQPPVVRT